MPVGVPHSYNCRHARARFLAALAAAGSVRGAIRATGENCRHLYRARVKYPEFAAAWAALVPPTPAWRTRPRASAKAGWQDRLIEGLARTGSVRRAARIAGVSLQLIDHARDKDPAFAEMVRMARIDGQIWVFLGRASRRPDDIGEALRIAELGRYTYAGHRIRPRRDEPEPEPHPLCPAASLRVPPPGKGRPRRA